MLSLYNVQARHITVPNVVVGMALFVGGAAQFVAGMWEFATANTFGATGEYRSALPPAPRRARVCGESARCRRSLRLTVV